MSRCEKFVLGILLTAGILTGICYSGLATGSSAWAIWIFIWVVTMVPIVTAQNQYIGKEKNKDKAKEKRQRKEEYFYDG